MIVVGLIMCVPHNAVHQMSKVCQACASLACMLTFWTGFVLRFFHTSRVCSGDFLDD